MTSLLQFVTAREELWEICARVLFAPNIFAHSTDAPDRSVRAVKCSGENSQVKYKNFLAQLSHSNLTDPKCFTLLYDIKESVLVLLVISFLGKFISFLGNNYLVICFEYDAYWL